MSSGRPTYANVSFATSNTNSQSISSLERGEEGSLQTVDEDLIQQTDHIEDFLVSLI